MEVSDEGSKSVGEPARRSVKEILEWLRSVSVCVCARARVCVCVRACLCVGVWLYVRVWACRHTLRTPRCVVRVCVTTLARTHERRTRGAKCDFPGIGSVNCYIHIARGHTPNALVRPRPSSPGSSSSLVCFASCSPFTSLSLPVPVLVRLSSTVSASPALTDPSPSVREDTHTHADTQAHTHAHNTRTHTNVAHAHADIHRHTCAAHMHDGHAQTQRRNRDGRRLRESGHNDGKRKDDGERTANHEYQQLKQRLPRGESQTQTNNHPRHAAHARTYTSQHITTNTTTHMAHC